MLILAGVLLAQTAFLAPLSRIAPLWVLLPTALLTGVQLARDARIRSDSVRRASPAAVSRRRRQIRITLWIAAAAALVYLVGFMIAAGLFLLFYIGVESSLGWRRSLLVSAGTLGVLYLVFDLLAGMRFPVGVIF
jgi:hypothetical protein